MLTCRAAFRANARKFPFCQKEERTDLIVIKTAVARRYAQALFELLDTSTIESTRTALTGLGQAIKDSASLRHVVASPTFGAEDKIAVLAELGSRLGCPPVGKTFLAQLVKKNRVGFLPEIAEAFAKLADASKGTQQITVSSAAALPPAEQDRISTRLREMLKRQVDVTFHTDARHLAGVQIQLGSTVVDSTVRGRLQAMQSLLTKE
jgi:F-type H+-transporting ATPase subunit delta